jgi:hypothetical protein
MLELYFIIDLPVRHREFCLLIVPISLPTKKWLVSQVVQGKVNERTVLSG